MNAATLHLSITAGPDHRHGDIVENGMHVREAGVAGLAVVSAVLAADDAVPASSALGR